MSRRRKPFRPTRDQIDCAKNRIQGYLEKFAGSVQMGSENDLRTLHRHITQPRDLGCKYEEQMATLRVALDELKSEKRVAWDSNTQMMGVTYAFKRRERRQRYPVRRMAASRA